MLRQDLLRQIEKKREELISIASQNGLNSLSAIKHSQELDHLLNIYNQTPSRKANNL
ncbi:aspartyl-phosphate phosphatase Spo0E family protein [Bacillus sp. CGMCC 1.16541]|uniref:aspartyl-phosphate phosphatase Spo0E family protein n=1 Tax=Bacillus sp. CGMCC 1.16541 TaxID=2185143 RepID=UPI000D72C468|nr:aspartyl-phosphate phosphatase Spo0E family protein [Bacillus sp. CGMCC 1.16541]